MQMFLGCVILMFHIYTTLDNPKFVFMYFLGCQGNVISKDVILFGSYNN